jgi:hypothetical protein
MSYKYIYSTLETELAIDTALKYIFPPFVMHSLFFLKIQYRPKPFQVNYITLIVNRYLKH